MGRLPAILMAIMLTATASAQVGTDLPSTPVGDIAAPDTPVPTSGPDTSIGAGSERGGQSVRAGTHSIQYSFDLPLDGQAFRLRADDGGIRHEIDVTVTRSDGRDLVAPSLRIDNGRTALSLEPISLDGAEATFTLNDTTLLINGPAAWTLSLRQGGDVPVWSSYDRKGPETSLAARGDGTPVHIRDRDGDGWANDIDNCPKTANDQANMDGDLRGDACDEDIDGDGETNAYEQAVGSDPRDPASTPDDIDGDGHNNSAEADAGSDPRNPKSIPSDPDADGFDNEAEAAAGSDPRRAASTPMDPDADGHEDLDNCPNDPNISQRDDDRDGIGNACDDNHQDGPLGDADADGVRNDQDLCPATADAEQSDVDGDGRGDACDPDADGDNHANVVDAFPLDSTEWVDFDEDGLGDNSDPDDDNDGIEDTMEVVFGTDPFNADTDADRYGDALEITQGTNPLDHHDPAYLPTEAKATVEAGQAVITWTPRADERVDRHVVWVVEDRRIVATVDAEALPRLVDTMADGNATYAVQPVFEGDAFEHDLSRSLVAVLMDQGGLVVQSQAAEDGTTRTANSSSTTLAPSEDAPGATWILVALGVLALARLRRR